MGRMDNLMLAVEICKEFGWTYDEYMSQPNFFLTIIREKMVRDQKAQELELRKHRV